MEKVLFLAVALCLLALGVSRADARNGFNGAGFNGSYGSCNTGYAGAGFSSGYCQQSVGVFAVPYVQTYGLAAPQYVQPAVVAPVVAVQPAYQAPVVAVEAPPPVIVQAAPVVYAQTVYAQSYGCPSTFNLSYGSGFSGYGGGFGAGYQIGAFHGGAGFHGAHH